MKSLYSYPQLEQSFRGLQNQTRMLIAENLEIETRLRQAEEKRGEAEKSAAWLLSDTGVAQAGRRSSKHN